MYDRIEKTRTLIVTCAVNESILTSFQLFVFVVTANLYGILTKKNNSCGFVNRIRQNNKHVFIALQDFLRKTHLFSSNIAIKDNGILIPKTL